MFLKILILVLLVAIVSSLFSGLFFLNRDHGRGRRTVRALTLRIGLSVLLFVTLLLGYHLGYVFGH